MAVSFLLLADVLFVFSSINKLVSYMALLTFPSSARLFQVLANIILVVT